MGNLFLTPRSLCACIAAGLALLAPMLPAGAKGVSARLYAGMQWRFIGPLRGGRTSAVSGVAHRPNVFYLAAVNGGIWKTDDAGRTWTPIFDDQPTGSVGALAVAPSDDNVIYAGSGEGLQRPDLAVGDGVYKSTDGGARWTHLGLRDAQQIASIAIDPQDPSRFFVAALGHPYGPNSERGLYRSLNGGKTFTRVLYVNENVGAFDVVIDPNNPQTVYATLWAARQAPWEASLSIAGSGVFKSIDGGTTWTQLKAGFPARMGRASLAVAPTNSQVVYAVVEALSGCGFYRSDDGGATFKLMNKHANIAQRCDDLTTIAVDPNDSDEVWLTNTSAYRSTDGGKHFEAVKGAPGGDDYHVMWINPKDPNYLILGSDQGATISLNGGRTWSSWYNQPTAQMFHASADDRFPYWVCGGQQESGSACAKSRGDWGAITQRDWHPVGAEEYGYVIPDPLHPGVFFGGKVQRFDERTGQTQEVSPVPLQSSSYRVVRTEPLAFDPLDKQALYFGANRIYVTRDAGSHWRTVSPDLARPHPALPTTVGSFEQSDPEHGRHRGVVYALALSYSHHGTIWAGTDDGFVWVTHDGGARWSNITPHGVGPWSKIAQIDLSRADDRSAFVAVTRFRLDDLHPYIYITHDGGAHWRLAVSGLPNEPVNAVRQDPDRRGLLYAATENGVYISFDDGWSWQSLQLNLPHTSVRDIIVHGDDLVVATHGRGFWILDDVEPLRELAARNEDLPELHLFAVAPTIRVRRDTNTDTPLPPEEPAGKNPPDGAIIDYVVGDNASHVAIEIFDTHGGLVRKYSSDDEAPLPIELDKPDYWLEPFVRPSADPGEHRFIWDLREPPPMVDKYDLPIAAVPWDTPLTPQGALVAPGAYIVKLIVDDRAQSSKLRVTMDPRVSMTQAQLDEQYQMARNLVETISRATLTVDAARARRDKASVSRLSRLERQALTLLRIIDGTDAPVTSQGRAAFCSLETRAHALGLQTSATATCTNGANQP